jgi:hypothetical protein
VEELFKTFAGGVSQQPNAYTQLLIAYDFALGPRREIVIAGDRNRQTTKDLVKVIRSHFLPRSILLYHPSGDEGEAVEKLAPFIKEHTAINNEPTAYVCENYACNLPTTSITELERCLGKSTLRRYNGIQPH